LDFISFLVLACLCEENGNGSDEVRDLIKYGHLQKAQNYKHGNTLSFGNSLLKRKNS
jgi:hypothetical protein